ncbi:MAG: hypothetical protein Q7R70_05075 [Candidatus Diapherotrites archaeon]|nr:hypothetical protein [Candidatus Diapherotrites archaeon]
MKLSLLIIFGIMCLVTLSGCAQNPSDTPLIVRQNFDNIDLSNFQNCKGVFLVQDSYDIGLAVFVAGDVAKGEIAVGDKTNIDGNTIVVKTIEGNKKQWDKAIKTYRVGLNFERQITKESYKPNDLICFNP